MPTLTTSAAWTVASKTPVTVRTPSPLIRIPRHRDLRGPQLSRRPPSSSSSGPLYFTAAPPGHPVNPYNPGFVGCSVAQVNSLIVVPPVSPASREGWTFSTG